MFPGAPRSGSPQRHGPSCARTVAVSHRNSDNKRLNAHGDLVEHQASPSRRACSRRLSMGYNADRTGLCRAFVRTSPA
jgi:hypothetical protein